VCVIVSVCLFICVCRDDSIEYCVGVRERVRMCLYACAVMTTVASECVRKSECVCVYMCATTETCASARLYIYYIYTYHIYVHIYIYTYTHVYE